MPASHFDVKPMTGRSKFIVRHSTIVSKKWDINITVLTFNVKLPLSVSNPTLN
jgi:hypothetical protein